MESPAAQYHADELTVDDRTPAAEYRCPGESYSISRQVHLGRLTMSYPPCRECPHRHDTGVLSKRTVARLQRTPAQAVPDAAFSSEAVEGVYQNQITPRLTRDLGAALGVYLRRHAIVTGGSATPAVVIAGDDRPCTPELMAAASEGLRMCGCDVCEIAPATAACLVAAIAARDAEGGLLIGNASSRAANVGIKFWGAGGRPLSSPGDLDGLRGIWEAGVDRPTRSYGGLERFDAQSSYLAALHEHFHALRPLRFVLATACGPLLGYLRTLLATTACEVLPRTTDLSRDVRSRQAHFGLWIDGDGETCRLVDEQGRAIETETFVALLANAGGCLEPLAANLPSNRSHVDSQRFLTPSTRMPCSHVTREQMHRTVCESGETVRGGAMHAETAGETSSLIVFRDRPGAGDALRALALLLTILSTSDRPLSAVVEDARQK